MKIVFCQPTMQYSGSENSLLQIVKLLKNEIEIDILYGEEGPFLGKIYEEISSEKVTLVKSVKLKRSLDSIFGFCSSFYRLFKHFRKVKKNKNYDAVIVNTLMFPQAYVGAWLNGFKVFIICRENYKTYGKLPFSLYAIVALLFSHKIIVLFNKQVTYFPLYKFFKKFELIPNTIKNWVTPILLPEKSYEPLKILSVIGTSKRKGFFDLLKVAEKIYKIHGQKVIFKIVGSTDDKLIDQFYQSNPNLINSVFFTGKKTQLKEYYEEADILIHPSHTEALPRVVLEAISYGLPVIATDVGGTESMVFDDQNGKLFSVGDIECCVDAVNNLYLNEMKRREFGQKSLDIFNKNFREDIIKNKFLKLFNA